MLCSKSFKMMGLNVVLVVFLLIVLENADGKRFGLMDDEDSAKIRNKGAECVFGKQVRELGSQWIPDLGVPIGVLYCMRCECVAFHRRRRITAKVQCRSIKNECPQLTCKDQVKLPGRCCSSCVGDTSFPALEAQDIIPQNVIEDEERSTKHYAALLSGRSSMTILGDDKKPLHTNDNKNNVVATGRFTFQRKNLHYSFYISEKAARPYSLWFLNSNGIVLEEHILSGPGGLVTSIYQNTTRKVCGIWRRLPRDYRRLLKEEKLYVGLVWGDFVLTGQLTKYIALGTEIFSSLLEPAHGTDLVQMQGAGGTAIISTIITQAPSIHIAVVFNGLFTADETSHVPVNITLAVDGKQNILQETVKVHKPAPAINVVEVSSPVSSADLRLLTRGKLTLSISSMSEPLALRLSGNVLTKATCELFQTTLSSAANDRHGNPSGASGVAWMYLNNEGSLVFNVQIDGLKQDQMRDGMLLSLVDYSTKRRTELEDLTPYFVQGWANGTLAKLGPKVLEPLYSGNLAVNVATKNDSSLIRGRLSGKLVADAKDSPKPFLLKREDTSLPHSAVGIAWIKIDNDCHIHYDINLNGMGPNHEKHYQVVLIMLPMSAPGAPVTEKVLEDFQGHSVEGSPTEPLLKDDITRLDSGVNYIKIKDRRTNSVLLSVNLKGIKIPQICLPPTSQHSDNEVSGGASDTNPLPSTHHNGACWFEGRFYQDEAQWTSASNPCKMCFCQNNELKCDITTCPKLHCPSHLHYKPQGECCHICANSSLLQESTPKGCMLAGKFHLAGTRFHPFLIPNGFDLCTECFCDPERLEVECTRLPVEKGCMSKTMRDTENGTLFRDDDVNHIYHNVKKKYMKNVEQIMREGGCKNHNDPYKPYENGQKFHPFIESLGEYKCVTCRCKNGTQSCERQRCTKAMCHKLLRRMKNDVTPNTNELCCNLQQCKRFRRHHRGHTR